MQRIKLSTVPGVVNAGINLSQYDVGREIAFDLYDYNGPYTVGSTDLITMRATKPSGFSFDVTATTASSNTVIFEVTDTMSAEFGSFPAELRITNGGDILGTANFLWNVEQGPKQDGTVDGNAEAQGLMQAIQAAITDAEEAAARANEAGLSSAFKEALLDCFEHVAWIGNDGQDYYDALYAVLYPPVPATSVSLNLSTLKAHSLNVQDVLVATVLPADTTDTVSWSSSDTSVATVDEYGTVSIAGWGSATITATAGSVSATCAVSVTQVSSISAVFTQGTHVVYSDDTLDSLKPYLVVTATYSDSSTEELASTAYTLSGTLTVGTSTITATYYGKTDTFSVTVSAPVQHYAIVNNLTHVASSNPTVTVDENDSFATSLGVQTGYTLQSVSVTMGGVDVTSTVYNSGTQSISITAVTGNVVITATAIMTPTSISAVYTQGGAIYTDDTLNDLIADLVVTATYPDTSTETIASTDYTLSGSLTSGTSTITVTYLGLTTTFTVTVTAPLYSIADFAEQTVTSGSDTYKISKTDGYYTFTSKASGSLYIHPDGTASMSRATSAWFQTIQGKTLKNEVLDVTWSNPSSSLVSLDVKYSKSNTTGNLYTASLAMAANSSGSGDTATPFESAGLSAGQSISGLALQFSNVHNQATTATFKIRLFMDGTRYL